MSFKLDDNESLVLDCKKHWFAYLPDTILVIVLFFVPYVAYSLFGFDQRLAFVSGQEHLLTFAYVGWFLILWITFFVRWTNIFLDSWIVTDERIIDIDQTDFFHRSVQSFRYDAIQDVSIHTRGFFSSILDYADIHIRTAGLNDDLKLVMADRPERIRQAINDAHDTYMAHLANLHRGP